MMEMKELGELVNTYDRAAGEAAGKRESHTPGIDAPDSVSAGEVFEVRVSVGPHPNSIEHSIRRIALYFEEEGRAFNPVSLAMVFFDAPATDPYVVFRIRLSRSGVIHATEYCSLHGLWSGRKPITVL